MEITRPRGTRDFLFDEMEERKYVESIIRNVFETYSYREIKTPIFENLSLFTEKSGEEIVEQLYNFKDKSGRELALRPEITAPVARLYLNKLQKTQKPIKMYYYGSCFRYERPQAGRFRQFWQFGCELIGAKSPEGDAEVIKMASQTLEELHIQGYEIHIGHLGILKSLFEHFSISDDYQEKIMTSIDKGVIEDLNNLLVELEVNKELSDILIKIISLKGGVEIIQELEKLVYNYDDVLIELENFNNLISTLDDFQMKDYVINLGIARGLDYYTGMVFEVYVPRLGAQKQICGGGTYSLIELFGGEKVDSTGFAFGFDRLMAAVDDLDIKPSVEVFIAPISESTRSKSFEIAQTLRENGIKTELDLSRKKFKKILSYANNLNVKYVVIVGERDLEEGNLTVKNMDSGDQKIIKVDEIVSFFKQ